MIGRYIVFFTLMAFASLVLMGCNQTPSVGHAVEESITLRDMEGNLVATTSDKQTVQQVVSILNARVPAKEKILPIFEYEILYQEQRWLLTTNGYIRDNTQKSETIYRLKQTQTIVNLLLEEMERTDQ